MNDKLDIFKTPIYVKKIWSLNPTKFKYIEFNKAQSQYYDWLLYVIKESPYFDKKNHIKNFNEWLKTEI